MRSKRQSGQIIVVAVGVLVLLLILVPALVRLVATESRWTVRDKRDATAFYLAETGVERGYWKLQDDPDYFAQLASAPISGYDFDALYADMPSTAAPSGVYAIKLSSYSLFGTPITPLFERVITAAARESFRQETATVELVVQMPGLMHAPLQARNVGLTGGGEVHWGPILAMSSMTLSGGAINRWPRKYARASINGGPQNTDLSPAQPNYDTDNPAPHSEFWSYNEPPGVPDPPSIDLAYYRGLAQCSTCAAAAGYPGGAYYYTSNIVVSNAKDTQPAVRFAEANLKFTGCVATMGVMISLGQLNFAGGPCNTGQAPPGRYPQTVPIPSSAWLDYRKIDTSAAGEYPGDIGGPGSSGVSPTYVFGAPADTNTSAQLTITHHGFLFAGSTWSGTGGTVIVGTVLAPVDDGAGAGGVSIYYQDNIAIKGFQDLRFTRLRWSRMPAYWPPGL